MSYQIIFNVVVSFFVLVSLAWNFASTLRIENLERDVDKREDTIE